MGAIAGEEESGMVVGRKVYQVGLAAVVLEFRQNLKFVGFVRILFSLFQNRCLHNFYASCYVKISCFDTLIFTLIFAIES